VPNHNALTVADKIVPEFFCRFGIPKMHSDQGREFESLLFQAVCHRLDLDKTRTTPYRSQSDGFAERFNGTLQIMLSSFVKISYLKTPRFYAPIISIFLPNCSF
jgi:transposase InsO family protein